LEIERPGGAVRVEAPEACVPCKRGYLIAEIDTPNGRVRLGQDEA